jgi:NAD kinase
MVHPSVPCILFTPLNPVRPRGPAARGVPLRRAHALGVEIAAFGRGTIVVAESPCGGPNASVPRDAAPDAGAPRAQHSLSFRPIVLPVSVRVTLRLTPTARSPAWVSFDGRQRQPLESGDELVISIACVCLSERLLKS